MAWFQQLLENAMNDVTRNLGFTPKAGERWGDKAWDGTRWIQEGNIGDPQQVLQNRSMQSDLAQNYLNWDSPYNLNMRKWIERMFYASTGGADSLFAAGVDPSSGVGRMSRAITRQRAANDAAQAGWQQYVSGQQLGVQAQLAHDQGTDSLRGQLNQRQMFNDQRRDALTGDILGGIVDLGLTAATGGFSGLAGAASGMLSGETQSAIDSMVDESGNLTGTLATPNYVPSMSRFEGTPDFEGALKATAPTTTNTGTKKSSTVKWGNALNTPRFNQQPYYAESGDYAGSLMNWQGPYTGVPSLKRNTDSGLSNAWWNVNTLWRGY